MGKIYVCSDIHAHQDALEEALSLLNPDDMLYMIGDAVDKGPDGLKPLLTIMKDPRCEMLAGNHDMMFLHQCLCLRHKSEIPAMMIEDIFSRWQILNYGYLTWHAFENRSTDEQDCIIDYLENRPLMKILEVENRKFILVHAAIPHEYDVSDLHDLTLDAIRDETYPFLYNWKSDFVWGRYVTKVDGYTTIVGHTAAQSYGVDHVRIIDDVWYDIDCGLAYNEESSRLALLCLNDMTITYLKPKKLGIYSSLL